MPLDTQPAREDGLEDGADDGFTVIEPAEVADYLQRLIDTRALINVSAPDGSFLTTMLWWVDPASDSIGLSVDEGQDGLQQVSVASEAVAVGHLENEKLQFGLAGMRLERQTQGLALQARLPRQVVRYQLRKSFRVRAPSFSTPTLRFRMPGDPDNVIVGRIRDISAGGCGLLVPPGTPAFALGTVIPSCRVDLDLEERFIAGFEIRRSDVLTGEDGAPEGTLLGCRWSRLDSGAERILQVYINRQQKLLRPAPARK